MNLIQSVFTERGFLHTEIGRKGQWRLFERQGMGRSHWEVVRIITKPKRTVFGREVEATEVYPPSEAWGINGFTLNCLDSARLKLESMAE